MNHQLFVRLIAFLKKQKFISDNVLFLEKNVWFQHAFSLLKHCYSILFDYYSKILRADVLTIARSLKVFTKWVISSFIRLLSPHIILQLFKSSFQLIVIFYFGLDAFRFMVQKWKKIQHMVVLLGSWLFGDGEAIRKHNTIKKLNNELNAAENYEDWEEIASELDLLEGSVSWKQDPCSQYYDHKKISENLKELRELLMEPPDIKGIIFFLRSRLQRNFHGIDNQYLHTHLRVGTKTLIEEYIAEVVSALQVTMENSTVDSMETYSFFNESRHAYGRSALMFSGGGTLGMYHTGLMKALLDQQLLPRILSGSSVGSIYASVCGSKTDSEIYDLILSGGLALDFFYNTDKPESIFIRLKRFLSIGAFYDMKQLQSCLKSLLGNMTFQEAHDRTGRIVNITISPSSGNFNKFLLLNYLTAPNVLLWSACCASSAIPSIFAPVQLMAKNAFDEIVPYHTDGVTWIDGTFMSDLPMQKLSVLFNVNYFIVSQVNPHIIPVAYTATRLSVGFVPSLIRLIFNCWRGIFSNILNAGPPHMQLLGPLRLMAPVLTQTYRGDITYIPIHWEWSDFGKLLSNPSAKEFKRKMEISELETYPLISSIMANCSIEFALDKGLRYIRTITEAGRRKAKSKNNRFRDSNLMQPRCRSSNLLNIKPMKDRVASFAIAESLSHRLRSVASRSSLDGRESEDVYSHHLTQTHLSVRQDPIRRISSYPGRTSGNLNYLHSNNQENETGRKMLLKPSNLKT